MPHMSRQLDVGFNLEDIFSLSQGVSSVDVNGMKFLTGSHIALECGGFFHTGKKPIKMYVFHVNELSCTCNTI